MHVYLGFTGNVNQGLSDALQSNFAGLNTAIGPTQQTLLNAADLSKNPWLAPAISAAINPITNEYLTSVLPGIRNRGIQVGQTGSSREGVAEGLAARNYMQAVGDTASNLTNQAYQSGLGASGDAASRALAQTTDLSNFQQQLGSNWINQLMAQQQGKTSALSGNVAAQMGLLGDAIGQQASLSSNLGATQAGQNIDTTQLLLNSLFSGTNSYADNLLRATGQMTGDQLQAANQMTGNLPSLAQLQLLPAQVQEAVGGQQQQQAQAKLNAAMQQYYQKRQYPLQVAEQYMRLLGGIPGGTTTTSLQQPAGAGFTNAIGGALAGAQLGRTLEGVFTTPQSTQPTQPTRQSGTVPGFAAAANNFIPTR